MKKVLLALIILLVIPLMSCESKTIPYTGEIKIGYEHFIGEMDFNGLVAFTIPDPIIEEDETESILFEYGHIYNPEQYDLWYQTFSLAVFVSESSYNHYRNNGEYTTLYEEVIEDFVTDEYRCEFNISNMLDKPDFNKSFELDISSEDIPYEKGKLYFVLCKGIFTYGMEENLPTVYQVIYFTNYEGSLSFTKDNPF